MLNRYELLVAKEESERVDTLRYSWQKLQSLAVSTLMTICHIFSLVIDIHMVFALIHIAQTLHSSFNFSLQAQGSNFFSWSGVMSVMSFHGLK